MHVRDSGGLPRPPNLMSNVLPRHLFSMCLLYRSFCNSLVESGGLVLPPVYRASLQYSYLCQVVAKELLPLHSARHLPDLSCSWAQQTNNQYSRACQSLCSCRVCVLHLSSLHPSMCSLTLLASQFRILILTYQSHTFRPTA